MFIFGGGFTKGDELRWLDLSNFETTSIPTSWINFWSVLEVLNGSKPSSIDRGRLVERGSILEWQKVLEFLAQLKWMQVRGKGWTNLAKRQMKTREMTLFHRWISQENAHDKNRWYHIQKTTPFCMVPSNLENTASFWVPRPPKWCSNWHRFTYASVPIVVQSDIISSSLDLSHWSDLINGQEIAWGF